MIIMLFINFLGVKALFALLFLIMSVNVKKIHEINEPKLSIMVSLYTETCIIIQILILLLLYNRQ